MDIVSLYKELGGASARYSTDTRTLSSGDIYIALKGEQFDGNTFVPDALAKGARFAITTTPFKDDRVIVVTDTLKTMQDLAAHHRSTFSIPIIAIGGSNGKTTTKELIATVLSKKYNVHATKGNLNSNIGVPSMLLEMRHDTQIAVIEIGANHPHEHELLMDILKPTHVLVTNNGADHLEGFGTLEGVRKANGEIYERAKALNATAFVNSLLPDLMEDSAPLNRILYPLPETVPASTITAGLTYEGTAFTSKLFGSFNEANIAAAIALGVHFDVPKELIADAIESYEPTLKRSQIINTGSTRIIMDCYNANPTSMELSLNDFFRTAPSPRILIIGDMFELGSATPEAHASILSLIQSHVTSEDTVIIVGPRFEAQKNTYPYHFFPTSLDAREFVQSLDFSSQTIFLKGSRGIRLEETIKGIVPL